jgi:hypothetical protein
MRKYYLPVLLCCLLACAAFAQEKLQYSSMNYAGLLEGDNGSAFQLQTVQGIKYHQWFTGIGTGLDYYYLRSVPLFLSLNRNLFNKPRTPYVSLDGGINFAWERRERSRWNDFISSDFSPAFYWGAGLGYKVGLRNKKDELLLNIGYTFKQLKEEQEKPVFCINPPCPPNVERYNYKLNRLSVRLGWQL